MRIALKKAYTDGTVAVEMDPLSLLCRLATSVPPPRFHTGPLCGLLDSPPPEIRGALAGALGRVAGSPAFRGFMARQGCDWRIEGEAEARATLAETDRLLGELKGRALAASPPGRQRWLGVGGRA